MSRKSRFHRSGLPLTILLAFMATLAPASPASAQTVPNLGSLSVSPARAPVGTQVDVQGAGLPPGADVELSWETVSGGWVTRDYYHFGGKQFTESRQSLGGFPVGMDGQLTARITVPEDYGGVHNIVALQNGTPYAQGSLDLTQSFEMVPEQGPIGTPVEIRAQGLGWQTLESIWALNWDNREVGWVSGLNTHGTAVARFRASGPVGDHVLKLYTGYMGQPYLNHEQAPTAYLPRPDFVFRTTPGAEVPSAYAEPYVPQPIPATTTTAGTDLQLSSTQGPVGSPVTLSGSGFSANAPLSVVWQTMVGNRLAATGFEPREQVIGSIETGLDGRLSWTMNTPDDLGGLHAISLRADDQEVARAYYVIETSIVSMAPASGPVGTTVTIHLKGVGWTEYDNIYTVNYDNAYMGYACGFNSQGDVVMNFTASGDPGVHLIDLYPGLYDGPRDAQLLYRLPQLTYATDHPGNTIPALRFAFTITDSY